MRMDAAHKKAKRLVVFRYKFPDSIDGIFGRAGGADSFETGYLFEVEDRTWISVLLACASYPVTSL